MRASFNQSSSRYGCRRDVEGTAYSYRESAYAHFTFGLLTPMTRVACGGVRVLAVTVFVSGGGVVDCETSPVGPIFKFDR